MALPADPFMAKFLNTSATKCFLEQLIKDARDRLILTSPHLTSPHLNSTQLTSTQLNSTQLTARGKDVGGEFRMSPKFGPYFRWPEGFKP